MPKRSSQLEGADLCVLIDRAAANLLEEARAFTIGNLFHAVRRAAQAAGRPVAIDRREFVNGPLKRRLRAGAIAGLLPPPTPCPPRRLPMEWSAYFPAAILLVDRPELVDLIVASGALIQGRVAPLALDGTPAHVIRWLRRGFLAGHRAPIAYIHDAATLVYPFTYEPLATLVEITRDEPLGYQDLGLPPGGRVTEAFPFASAIPKEEKIVELEALPPAAFVAYAVRGALALVPPDPLLAPLDPPAKRSGEKRPPGKRRTR